MVVSNQFMRIKHKYFFNYFSALITVIFISTSYAQHKPNSKFLDPREAQEHFEHKNYQAALRVYKELLKRDPDDAEYNLKAALCYLNTNLDKTQAIQYLEKVVQKDKNNSLALFYLGNAYQYANRFDEAIKSYTAFKEKSSKKDLQQAERAIETCENGKQLIKFPLNVTFENLGKDVNSEYPDYHPFATQNESFMVFTSRRKGGKGSSPEMDGFYASDIYMTTVKNGNWIKASNIGSPVNTPFDEQAVGLSPDGESMTVYIDHIDSLGNIYISNYNKEKFQRLKKLNSNVNSGFETSGSISADGEIIFFSSERNGGIGGTDLYMAKKLPSGLWAIPQNLGSVVNTIYNEDFPHFSEDGKTLYFASQGHSSMGGYDIFKSTYNAENNTWTKPENLGYPINTSDNDYTISYTENERSAYISRVREGGMGDLDIWRLRFNESEQRYTLISGYVNLVDSTAKREDLLITAINLSSNEQLVFTPLPSTGKYVMALVPGKYTITVEGKNCTAFTETMTIFDKGSFQREINKNFDLSKKP
ncbi:MAG: PD40 domain-containing protein [Bacteroidia bacterium]|nr:PD40 domain-containing protein [Bacteroidia bacterium]